MSTLTRAGGILVATLALAACTEAPAPAPAAGTGADLVFENGAVYTVDAARSWAAAVAIRGERIVYVGTNAGAQAFVGPATRVVDLGGRLMLPGFHDAHIHPVSAGVAYQACPLFDAVTQAEALARIRACVAAKPNAPFIRGDGWLVTLFPNGIPHKRLLDQIDDSRPLYFESSDGHSLWINSSALEVSGITDATPDPPGGRIERDPHSGEAIGVLQEEAAMAIALAHAPYSAADVESGLRYAVEHLNGLGITSIQDALVKLEPGEAHASLEAYRTLDEAGELTLRAVLALGWDDERGPGQVEPLSAARERYTGGRVRATAVKIYLDGVIETQTAALLEPYLDGGNVAPYLRRDALNAAVSELDRQGFQVHVHAIGDGAIRAALDAFEHARALNGPRDSRHHICHLQLIDPADIARFRPLGVIANFQPLWALMDDYITELTIPRLGEERGRWLYPIGSVLRTGATVAFGSDWSVSTADPLPQIETAITREDAIGQFPGVLIPEERIELADAIAAFTINAAYVNFQEQSTGSIEAGKLADLVVLDRNLFELEPRQISEARVVLTLFGGRVVHGALDSF